MASKAHTTFKAKAPGIMARLLADFPVLEVIDTAAILGNLGTECAGFTKLQEIAPTVKGSRGGYGWPQWTGPRRRAYEAYCRRNQLDPASDKANYAYLFLELKGIEGSEGKAIAKLVAAGPDLEAKVIAFERAFLRAGIPHYDSRLKYAELAIEAWRTAEAVGEATGLPPQPFDAAPEAAPAVPPPENTTSARTDDPAGQDAVSRPAVRPSRTKVVMLALIVVLGGLAAFFALT